MKCPHCLVEFHDESEMISLPSDIDGQWTILSAICPSCKKANFVLTNSDKRTIGLEQSFGGKWYKYRQQVWPKTAARPPIPSDVPKSIAEDYMEACLVLSDSPKASAALSRRCLQTFLREHVHVKKSDLSDEIQQLLDMRLLPLYISENIDAVRNIGNFAAHPTKSATTNEIVEVEEGEAQWTLEVLEMLFDFFFVQLVRNEERRKIFNKKLTDAGKPKLK